MNRMDAPNVYKRIMMNAKQFLQLQYAEEQVSRILRCKRKFYFKQPVGLKVTAL